MQAKKNAAFHSISNAMRLRSGSVRACYTQGSAWPELHTNRPGTDQGPLHGTTHVDHPTQHHYTPLHTCLLAHGLRRCPAFPFFWGGGGGAHPVTAHAPARGLCQRTTELCPSGMAQGGGGCSKTPMPQYWGVGRQAPQCSLSPTDQPQTNSPAVARCTRDRAPHCCPVPLHEPPNPGGHNSTKRHSGTAPGRSVPSAHPLNDAQALCTCAHLEPSLLHRPMCLQPSCVPPCPGLTHLAKSFAHAHSVIPAPRAHSTPWGPLVCSARLSGTQWRLLLS